MDNEKQEKGNINPDSFVELSLPPTNEIPRPQIPNPDTNPNKENGKETDKKE